VPLIAVTRLRLRDAADFDTFFAHAVAVVEQAQTAEGNVGAEVLADAHHTYWTRTAWQDRARMSEFMLAEPHLATMYRLDEWCDEATFVDWEQPGAALPDWQDAYARLVADGQVANLSNPTSAHHTRRFPAPVETP
jgi:hypothetical protein